VEMNRSAFAAGRRAAADPRWASRIAEAWRRPTEDRRLAETPDEVVDRRVAFLADYQDAAYGERYRARVRRFAEVARARLPDSSVHVDALAHNLFKLMAIKDEYEVARLYTDGNFARQLAATFEGDLRLEFHMAPPIFARRDPATGHLRKQRFGPFMFTAMKWLARARRLRGTMLDPFARMAERREERALLAAYEQALDAIETTLSAHTANAALTLIRLPEKVRGFGHVKAPKMRAMQNEMANLLVALGHPSEPPAVAAE
jgi:indolepyruvate ferredoxin oxidoreductase